MDKPAVFLVGTQCAPELDAKFNKWYSGNHIPILMKSPHLLGVTRYKVSPATAGDNPTYLAIYLFKDKQGWEAWRSGPDMLAAREERKQSWKGGKDDFEAKWMALFEPLKTWPQTKEKTPAMFVVGTKPPPELDDKFNKWYNGTHIPMLLKSKLLLGVTRYKLSPGIEGPYPPYLALYEFRDRQGYEKWNTGAEMLAAREELKQSWKGGRDDFERVWRVLYEPLKTWSK